ncbi:diguanylate cyclase [Paenibacillus sp. CC-CFT747]|nr:diguanylate cyclase [Paenibacillus sp. CC-CFT747]
MLVYTREPNEAAQLIKAIQGDVNRLKLAVRGQPVRVTLSFGAVYSGDCPTKNELAEYADKLLYAAKAQGRNRAVFEDGKRKRAPGRPPVSTVRLDAPAASAGRDGSRRPGFHNETRGRMAALPAAGTGTRETRGFTLPGIRIKWDIPSCQRQVFP